MDFVVKVISTAKVISNNRQRNDYGDLQEFAERLEEEGLMHPIGVEDLEDGTYRLIFGGRRLAAFLLKLKPEIPAHIYPKGIDDLTAETLELSENIRRKDITWVEKVEAQKRVHNLYIAKYGEKTSTSPDAPGHSVRDTAKLLNVSNSSIADDIAMAKNLEAMPELKTCKTQQEARKMVAKIVEKKAVAELAERARVAVSKDPESLKARIIDSYVIGDFFEAAAKIPDNMFGLIECDPPYGVDYSTSDRAVGDRSLTTADYNEISSTEYEKFLYKLCDHLYRILSPTGWLLFWYADDPWGEVVYKALTEAGFIVPRHHPMWYKGTGQTLQPSVRLAGDYASFYYCRKANAAIAKEGHGLVFGCPPVPPQSKYHPTQRPVKLMQEIMETFAFPGTRVLVPFAGSGCSLLAAANLGLPAIGYDLSVTYKDYFTKAVTEGEIGKF